MTNLFDKKNNSLYDFNSMIDIMLTFRNTLTILGESESTKTP